MTLGRQAGRWIYERHSDISLRRSFVLGDADAARFSEAILRFGGDPTKDSVLIAMHAAAPQIPLAGRAICSPFSQTLALTNPNLQAGATKP